MKRFLAFILIVAVLFSDLMICHGRQFVVYAEDDVWTEENFYHKNPLLENDSDEVKDDNSELQYKVSQYTEPEYISDLDEVIERIRHAMVNREETFTIYYTQNERLEKGFLNEWIKQVVEETEEAEEGDYLRWHYESVSLNSKGKIYSNGICKYELRFTVKYYTTLEQELWLAQEVSHILNELDITENVSDYNKLKKIYTYICDNVSYDYEHLNSPDYKLQYTAYAALMDKKAVCQGFSSLLYYMAKESGLDVRIVTGVSRNEEHGWNIVKLDDLYYYLDSTWDAGKEKYNFFLKGTDLFKDHSISKEYLTEEYEKSYPMSTIDYSERIKQKCEHIFEDYFTLKKASFTEKGMMLQICMKCQTTKRCVIAKAEKPILQNTAYLYNGSVKRPKIVVKNSEGDIIPFTCSYQNGRKKVGKYKITVQLAGKKYKGIKDVYFTINPKAPSIVKTTLCGRDNVKIQWKKCIGADGYMIYFKKDFDKNFQVAKTKKTSYKKWNLTKGSKYTFKVVPFIKENDELIESPAFKTSSIYISKI